MLRCPSMTKREVWLQPAGRHRGASPRPLVGLVGGWESATPDRCLFTSDPDCRMVGGRRAPSVSIFDFYHCFNQSVFNSYHPISSAALYNTRGS